MKNHCKYLVFLILIFTLNCEKKTKTLEKPSYFITKQQKESFVSSIDFFDFFLKEKYKHIDNPDYRLYLFIKDYEAAYYTLNRGEKFSQDFNKNLEVFNPYLKELEQSGLLSLLVSKSYFEIPTYKNDLVQKWVDSIVLEEKNSFYPNTKLLKDTNNFSSQPYKQNDNKKGNSDLKKTLIFNDRNILYYSLYKKTNSNDSLIRKAISQTILGTNMLVILSNNLELRNQLSNQLIKSLIFYNTIVKLYDLKRHEIPPLPPR